MTSLPRKICLIGSGNWGSVIARLIGENVHKDLNLFHSEINMWVYEELIPPDNKKLTDIINQTHENIKYLPGYKIPNNIIAISDLSLAIKNCTILIFCLPHQFLSKILPIIKNELNTNQISNDDIISVSLIKGIDFNENGIVLISQIISNALNINCNVLMGANVADEVAAGQFCESTLGISNNNLIHGSILHKLFHVPNHFHVNVVMDPHGVEMCGALKNVIALGAGFCDGLKYGNNTKAAIIRIGLLEMKHFCFRFFDGIKEDTFFESCGIADLITTCFGGRNRKCAENFIEKGQKISWEEIEKNLLLGQKLQGTIACKEMYHILKKAGIEKDFPLFTMIYKIAFEKESPHHLCKL